MRLDSRQIFFTDFVPIIPTGNILVILFCISFSFSISIMIFSFFFYRQSLFSNLLWNWIYVAEFIFMYLVWTMINRVKYITENDYYMYMEDKLMDSVVDLDVWLDVIGPKCIPRSRCCRAQTLSYLDTQKYPKALRHQVITLLSSGIKILGTCGDT